MTEPGRMTTTPVRSLLFAVVITGIAVWGLTRVFYGSIPPLRWYTPIVIGVLAVAEGLLARQLRSRVRRAPGTEPLHPLGAARAVVLAKASAMLGAIVFGAWLGFLAYVGPQIGYLAYAGGDAGVAALGLVCGLGLVVAALFMEHALKSPDRPDDDETTPLLA